jgi:hypothetical protein
LAHTQVIENSLQKISDIAPLRPHITKERSPPFHRDEKDRMPKHCQGEQDGSDTMQESAHFEATFPAKEEPHYPAGTEPQRKARDDQNDEGNHQERVLEDFVGSHPSHLRRFPHRQLDLPPQVDQPMDHHESNDDHDGDDVYLLDDIRHRRLAFS